MLNNILTIEPTIDDDVVLELLSDFCDMEAFVREYL